MTSAQIENIGADRQLFVDDHWIDSSSGVERVLHEPVAADISIEAEHPWEQILSAYHLVLGDGSRWRMYYLCSGRGDEDGPPGGWQYCGYAESDDGVKWTKPELGVIEVDGSKRNNLVYAGPHTEFAPFLDDNPDAAESERYKAFAVSKRALEGVRGLVPLASPDGLTWRQMSERPVMVDGPFDSHNVPFWDTQLGKYVVYTRGVGNPDGSVQYSPEKGWFAPAGGEAKPDGGLGREFGGGVRWIRRAVSDDFINWSPLEVIDCGDTAFEHLYTNACTPYDRAPGTYLMFPSRFVPHRTPDNEIARTATPGVNDVVFMSSRDGINFDRSFMEAYIRPGLMVENWRERGVYAGRGIVQTTPTELSIYSRQHRYLDSVHIRRYSVRTDGFVSVNASYSGGEFTTRPFVFSGSSLELNYSTSAVGSVRVELQDEEGRALPGYGMGDYPEMFGDEIGGTARWSNGSDVSSLAGKPVRLRFSLNDADIYAFKFNP